MILFALALVVASCSSQPKKQYKNLDFSLDGSVESADRKTHNSQYYRDLKSTERSIPFYSSFPLSIAVGKKAVSSNTKWDQKPTPPRSGLVLSYGGCRLLLSSEKVQVHRYIFTNRFIQMGEELSGKSTLNVERYTELFLRMSSQLSIRIPKKFVKPCMKALYGKKTFLGTYNLFSSKGALIWKGQRKSFKKIEPEDPSGTRVYLYWSSQQKNPVIRNELDFPVVAYSSYLGMKLSRPGVYDLVFLPQLRHDDSKKRIVKIHRTKKLRRSH